MPVSVPVRHALGYASAALMLGCGLALLSKRASVAAARVLVAYWTLLVLLREVPVVVAHPLVEVAWQGVAHVVVLLAAACGVLFGVHARLAAALEAAMLAAFTFLVWIPRIVAAPTTQGLWSEFTISWAICAAVWVVAANIGGDESDRRFVATEAGYSA